MKSAPLSSIQLWCREWGWPSHRPNGRGSSTLSQGKYFGFPALFSGFWLTGFNVAYSIDKVPKVSSPVLVIHGTEDEVIDFSHGLAIYEKCPRAVEPLWVEVNSYLPTFNQGGKKADMCNSLPLSSWRLTACSWGALRLSLWDFSRKWPFFSKEFLRNMVLMVVCLQIFRVLDTMMWNCTANTWSACVTSYPPSWPTDIGPPPGIQDRLPQIAAKFPTPPEAGSKTRQPRRKIWTTGAKRKTLSQALQILQPK